MHTGSSDENYSDGASVCLSVLLSVERVIYDKTKEWYVQIFMMKFIRHEGSEHTETYNTINLKKLHILTFKQQQ